MRCIGRANGRSTPGPLPARYCCAERGRTSIVHRAERAAAHPQPFPRAVCGGRGPCRARLHFRRARPCHPEAQAHRPIPYARDLARRRIQLPTRTTQGAAAGIGAEAAGWGHFERGRRMPLLPSPGPLPQAGEGRIRSRFGWVRAHQRQVQSAKADFGPLLPRIQPPGGKCPSYNTLLLSVGACCRLALSVAESRHRTQAPGAASLGALAVCRLRVSPARPRARSGARESQAGARPR